MPIDFPIFWVAPRVARFISFFAVIDFEAITLGPLVISKSPLSLEVQRHERIHFLQYKELFFIFFLILYLIDFVVGYWVYRNWSIAYRKNRFEQEAFTFMHQEDYCRTRKPFAWKQFTIYPK